MLDLNVIYNEDCLDTMCFIKNESIDMVLTSPPYDGLRKYNGYSFEFENVAKGLFRILRRGGVIVWVVGDQTVKGSETGSSFKQALYFKEIGFNLYDTMIYRKENYAPKTHKRYEQAFEYMFILSKGVPSVFNPLTVPCKIAGTGVNWSRKGSNIKEGVFRRRDETIMVKDTKLKENVWTYSCGGSRTGHPAPFPLQLAVDHIRTWTNEGDIIYDPFMGSGTTAVAAKNLNRNFIGSEIATEYATIAINRIQLT